MLLVLVETLVGVELSFFNGGDPIESPGSISHRTLSSLDPFLAKQVGSVLLVEWGENIEKFVIAQQVVLISVMCIKKLENIFVTNALDLDVTFDQSREFVLCNEIRVAGVCDDKKIPKKLVKLHSDSRLT